MPKVTAAQRYELVVEECNYWFTMIQTYARDGNIAEADKYRFAIDGAKIVLRHMGNDKLVETVGQIAERAFRVIEEAKRAL